MVHSHCPDFTLVYEGVQFPTHKSVLLARCPYFKVNSLMSRLSLVNSLNTRLSLVNCLNTRLSLAYFKDLLLAAGSLATELIVKLATPGVDSTMFSSLLRFLYTGEYPSQNMTPQQIDLLISLGRECGVPNLLEVDLEHLYQSGEHTDYLLVFTGKTRYLGALATGSL